jgi:hypothetical protein
MYYFYRRLFVLVGLVGLVRLINFFDFTWLFFLLHFREPPMNEPFLQFGHMFETGILSNTLPHRVHTRYFGDAPTSPSRIALTANAILI